MRLPILEGGHLLKLLIQLMAVMTTPTIRGMRHGVATSLPSAESTPSSIPASATATATMNMTQQHRLPQYQLQMHAMHHQPQQQHLQQSHQHIHQHHQQQQQQHNHTPHHHRQASNSNSIPLDASVMQPAATTGHAANVSSKLSVVSSMAVTRATRAATATATTTTPPASLYGMTKEASNNGAVQLQDDEDGADDDEMESVAQEDIATDSRSDEDDLPMAVMEMAAVVDAGDERTIRSRESNDSNEINSGHYVMAKHIASHAIIASSAIDFNKTRDLSSLSLLSFNETSSATAALAVAATGTSAGAAAAAAATLDVSAVSSAAAAAAAVPMVVASSSPSASLLQSMSSSASELGVKNVSKTQTPMPGQSSGDVNTINIITNTANANANNNNANANTNSIIGTKGISNTNGIISNSNSHHHPANTSLSVSPSVTAAAGATASASSLAATPKAYVKNSPAKKVETKYVLPKPQKTDAPMLNYIFDTFSANKHHHHDQRYGPHFEDVQRVGQPTNITVQAGSSIHLNCRISLLQDKTVSWVRRNILSDENALDLLTVGLHTYTGDQRYKMEFQYPNNWRLKITNVKKDDEAMYECQISTHPPRVIQINLHVNAPKVMVVDEFGDPLQEKYYEIDSTLQLACMVRNVAMSSSVVYWKHGDAVLNYDVTRGGVSVKTELMEDGANSTLSIAKIKKADSGNYTCSISDYQNFTIVVHILNGESFAELHHGSCGPIARQPYVLYVVLVLLHACSCRLVAYIPR